eukprot:GHVU01067780.1.p2 GENE.GHVU01067780.1~~GHVU01067780.1.p2  ORF type:complete len:123 (-),score=25.04 GHVU01067780.1:230-598(-)
MTDRPTDRRQDATPPDRTRAYLSTVTPDNRAPPRSPPPPPQSAAATIGRSGVRQCLSLATRTSTAVPQAHVMAAVRGNTSRPTGSRRAVPAAAVPAAAVPIVERGGGTKGGGERGVVVGEQE